jgi:adenylosuccinate synthase
LQSIALTRLDVLDGLETIKICTGYGLNGKILDRVPVLLSALESVTPVYEELPGWRTPTSDVRDFDALPQQARSFIKRVETLLGCPVDLISVGPAREQAVVVSPIL